MQYAFSDVTSLTVSPSPLLCLSTLLFQYAGFGGFFGFSGLLGGSKIKRKDGYGEQRAGRQQNTERTELIPQSEAPSHMTHDTLSPMIVLWILGFQLRIALGEGLQYRLKVPVSWCGYEDLGY